MLQYIIDKCTCLQSKKYNLVPKYIHLYRQSKISVDQNTETILFSRNFNTLY